MTMEIERRNEDGHWYFRLGPVERWIVAAFAAAIVTAGYWMVSSVQQLVTQQALTNQKLTTIGDQMVTLNNLGQRVSTLEVYRQADSESLRDLKARVDRAKNP